MERCYPREKNPDNSGVITLSSDEYIDTGVNAPSVNTPLDAQAVSAAPVADGTVNADEYGAAPSLTYSEDKEQFAAPDDHDDYDNWDFDFYITWDLDNLYMAWVVRSEVHHPLTKATYDAYGNIISDEWPEDGSMLGHMWWNSCVEFLITPGVPDADGDVNYANNYFEAGVCELDDGSTGKVVWSVADNTMKLDCDHNEWQAIACRDDEAKTTTYEVAIPWENTGVGFVGNDANFGLSFAVAAQENYYVKQGMIEWNNAMLGAKQPNNAGVITLTGGTEETKTILVDGELPAEAENADKLVIDYLNKPLGSEKSSLCTDPSVAINTNWAYAMLLAPVEGKENVYTLIDAAHGEGSEVIFDQYEDGMLIFGVHSDDWAYSNTGAYSGCLRKITAMSIGIGSELTLFGVDTETETFIYSNAMFYVSKAAENPVDGVLGDCTGDGYVDMYDYMTVKSYYFKKIELSAEELKRADCYADGIIDMYDYMMIKQIYFSK